MRILYIGSERNDAYAIATALRGVDRGVTVSWASRLEQAVRWLGENHDAGALVVEARTNGGSWPSVLEHVRRLASRPAVIVIVPEGTGAPFESLHPEADDYVARDPSLLRVLPTVVARAVARAQSRQQAQKAVNGVPAARKEPVTAAGRSGSTAAVSDERRSQLDELFTLTLAARTDLERKLAEATAAFQDAERRHRAAMAEADEQLAERQAKYEMATAQAAATWQMVDEQLRTAAIEVERARQEQASTAAEVDRLSRRESELMSQVAETSASKRSLERRLADAEAAVGVANALTENERRAAIERLDERQREFEAQIAQEVDGRRSLEELLAQAVSAQEEAERRHATALTDAAVQSRELEATLRLSRMDVEAKSADIERLAQRETNLSATLADVTTSRDELDRRLAASEAAFEDSIARATRERLAASKKAAEREAELDAQIRDERATRARLEQAVANAGVTQREAQQRHEEALARAASELAERETILDQVRRHHQRTLADLERLTHREAELTSQLADIQTARDGLQREVTEAASVFAEVVERAAGERAAANERQERLEARLAQELATRNTLEQTVADANAAQRDAQQRHKAALASAASELAERDATLGQVRRDHQAAVADLERVRAREAELTTQLADVQAARDTLERKLADATSAIADATERAARDRAAATERQEELEARLAHESATRNTLQQAVADADAALREAQQRYEAVLASTASDLAERQSEFDRELTQMTADRDRLAERLSGVETTLDQIRRDHHTAAADVERLTQREADLTSLLADTQAARDSFERQLADATHALADHAERAAREQDEAARRLEELETRLAQELATHSALEQTLSETRAAALDAERSFREEVDALRAQGLEQRAHFEVQLAQGRLDHEDRLAAMEECKRKLSLERDALQQSVVEIQEQLHRLDLEHRAACERHEHARATADADIRRISTELRETELVLEEARAEFQGTLDHLSTEHGLALADLTASLNERDAQLQDQTMRTTASLQAAERARMELQVDFAAAMADRNRELDQLRQTLAASVQELEATKGKIEALQAAADQVPQLHERLDQSRAESHRLFEQAGLAMFRCTRDGKLIHANRAGTTLLGRRTLDELRGSPFAAAVFEAPNVLSWLIERCLSTPAKESIETTWRRNDGGRLFVRLSARLSSSDTIEIVAEDLTRLRVLQERLGQAQRMEAVGRFASEVAVTCGNLLSDIYKKGREWLLTAGDDSDSRRQGQLLLDEVSRAAGFLQQLADFGDEQARTPMLTDLNTLIRDLEPVLQRVAGGDVEVQVWDPTSPLNVEVRAERVERLLVNLASYGRGRMPFGGRLRIELGTSVVDRHFAAKHPNVRLGLHALITVTELRNGGAADSPDGRANAKPGVDFGTLQGLVSECGGHLWMKVQPVGDMVAKIRLPLSSPHEQALPRAVVARAGRERPMARWFHS